MATEIHPIIRAEDFEAFQRALGSHLPNTHDEWLYLANNWADEALKTKHTARQVEIDPQEFSAWLDTHGNDRTLHGLRNFAFHKRSREDR